MPDYAAYFCGQWLPFSQVRIDPLDRGFLVGDCVFDVARTFNGDTAEDWQDPELLEQLVRQSTRVSLADAQHLAVALKLP